MTPDDRFDLPDPSAANFLQRVRELLMQYLGRQGDPLNRGVTLRDLKALQSGSGASAASSTNNGSSLILSPGSLGQGAYIADLSPPPPPEGFTATAALTSFTVQVTTPTFTLGHGAIRAALYGVVSTDGNVTFANAAKLTEFNGTVYTHATTPATTWHLWLTFITRDGVESTSPAGGINGVVVTTGQDVSLLLAALNGKITTSQLSGDLAKSTINIINLQADLKTETAVRSSQVATTNAAITTEQTIRQSADNGLYAQYTVKLDVNGYVSGFGLASTVNNAGPYSSFLVRADSFSIASPAGPGITPVTPFSVVTTPTYINGKLVPVGVYMDAAYIKNGTITSAMIGKLSADTITSGTLTVGLGGSASFMTSQAVTDSSGNPLVSNSFTSTWNLNPGYYLGDQGGVKKFYVGNGSTAGINERSLSWDGTTLAVKGVVNAYAGTIGGINIGYTFNSPATSSIYSGTTGFNTGNGFWIDASGRMSLGNSTTGTGLSWDGSSLVMKSGSIMAGSYSSYSWPAANSNASTGFYLGSAGLLLGNYNNWVASGAVKGSGNGFFQLYGNGDIATPAFSVYGGAFNFNDGVTANILGTLQIRGNSITYCTSAASQNLPTYTAHGGTIIVVAKIYVQTNSNASVVLSMNGAVMDQSAVGGGGNAIGVPASVSFTANVANGSTYNIAIQVFGTFSAVAVPSITLLEVLR